MTPFSMVIPYYENPGMLVRQIELWNSYPEDLKKNIGFYLVDDGSPKYPAIDVLLNAHLEVQIRLWRIKEDIPWNQHGARNLGAKVVGGNGWLFMTDMDHLLLPEEARKLGDRLKTPCHFYTLARKSLPELEDYKYHCNTFAVTREAYWKVGGYDEDYCGTYGGDGPFLRQLEQVTPRFHLEDVYVIRVPREVIPDASTTQYERTGPLKTKYQYLNMQKIRERNQKATNPLRFTWERLL